MRALVFGAEGMIGSVLMRTLPDVRGTTRRWSSDPRILPGIDIASPTDLSRAFEWASPQVVINCAGIVKSACDAQSFARIIAVNSQAPHDIAHTAGRRGCRVIQLSTDCVFSGARGDRTEEHIPDADDLYGKSKITGELVDEHCVTLRTSFIGQDHLHRRGLLEWLLARPPGAVPGYTHALWSGLSTFELARVIGAVIENSSLSGLYHVAGPTISKADLLEVLIEAYGLRCRVQREDDPQIDRTLNGSKFAQAMNYVPPTWDAMAKELTGG